jgi:hypothetical protein
MNLRFLLPALALFSLGGCIVHRTFIEAPPSKSKKSGKSSRECHPSQYWDGDECRHKGQGKGARKHDD